MASRKKAEVAPEAVEEAAPPEVEETEAVEEAVPSNGSVSVTYPGGTREYSFEVHGRHFKKLAAEFAEKKRGTVA